MKNTQSPSQSVGNFNLVYENNHPELRKDRGSVKVIDKDTGETVGRFRYSTFNSDDFGYMPTWDFAYLDVLSYGKEMWKIAKEMVDSRKDKPLLTFVNNICGYFKCREIRVNTDTFVIKLFDPYPQRLQNTAIATFTCDCDWKRVISMSLLDRLSISVNESELKYIRTNIEVAFDFAQVLLKEVERYRNSLDN